VVRSAPVRSPSASSVLSAAVASSAAAVHSTAAAAESSVAASGASTVAPTRTLAPIARVCSLSHGIVVVNPISALSTPGCFHCAGGGGRLMRSSCEAAPQDVVQETLHNLTVQVDRVVLQVCLQFDCRGLVIIPFVQQTGRVQYFERTNLFTVHGVFYGLSLM
jgi:hypothetical protein